MFSFHKYIILFTASLLISQLAMAFHEDTIVCDIIVLPHHPASLIVLLDQKAQITSYPKEIQESIESLYDFSNSQFALPIANAIAREALNSEISTENQALAIHFLMVIHAILSLQEIRGASYVWVIIQLNNIYDYAQQSPLLLSWSKEKLFSKTAYKWMHSVTNQISLGKIDNLIVASESLYNLAELATGTTDWAELIVHYIGGTKEFPCLSQPPFLSEEDYKDPSSNLENVHESLLNSIDRYQQKNKHISLKDALVGDSILKILFGVNPESKFITNTFRLIQISLDHGPNVIQCLINQDSKAMLEKSDGTLSGFIELLSIRYKWTKAINHIMRTAALLHEGAQYSALKESIQESNAPECLNPSVLIFHIPECPLNQEKQNLMSEYRLSESIAPSTWDYIKKMSGALITGSDLMVVLVDKFYGINLSILKKGLHGGRFLFCFVNLAEKSYQAYMSNNQQKSIQVFKRNKFEKEDSIEAAIALGIIESIINDQAQWDSHQLFTSSSKLLREICIMSAILFFSKNTYREMAAVVIFGINFSLSVDKILTDVNKAVNKVEASKSLTDQFKALKEAITTNEVNIGIEIAKQIASQNRQWGSDFLLATLCEGTPKNQEYVRKLLEEILNLPDQEINDLCATYLNKENKNTASKGLLKHFGN
jgi:hypothetical protein